MAGFDVLVVLCVQVPQPVCFFTWESCSWGAVTLQEHCAAVAEVGQVVGGLFLPLALASPCLGDSHLYGPWPTA